MIGEISALASAVAIGLAAIISKKLTATITPLPLQTVRAWFGAVFLLILLPSMGRGGELLQLPWHLMGLIVGSGMLGVALGDTLYMETLSLTEASRVFPLVRGAQIIFTMIIAASFLGEDVTWALFLGAVLIMGGISLVALTQTGTKMNPGARPVGGKIWLLYGVAAGLCWTLSFTLMKLVFREIDPILANTFRMPVTALILSGLALWSGQGERLKIVKYGRATIGLMIASGVLSYGIGVVLELYAIYYAGIARAAILTSWTPIFVMFFAFLLLKERLTPWLGLGTVLCTIGTLIIVAF